MVDIALGLKIGNYKQCTICQVVLTDRKQKMIGYCPNCANEHLKMVGEVGLALLSKSNKTEKDVFQHSPKFLQKMIIKKTAKVVMQKPLEVRQEMVDDDIKKFELTPEQIVYYNKCLEKFK